MRCDHERSFWEAVIQALEAGHGFREILSWYEEICAVSQLWLMGHKSPDPETRQLADDLWPTDMDPPSAN